MAFNILGINHKTAPVALREKVAFSEERLLAALRTLRQQAGVAEVVILSTCNRTEVYWAGSASGAELSQWLERHHGHDLDLDVQPVRSPGTARRRACLHRGLGARLHGSRRGPDSGSVEGCLPRGAGGRQHRTCAQQVVPSGVLSGQARAIGDSHRRERRVDRLRHREFGAPRVFGLKRPYRPHGGCRRNECPDRPAFHERRGQAHGDCQSHPGDGRRLWPPNSRPMRWDSTTSTRNWLRPTS